jgi:hypothetical protein
MAILETVNDKAGGIAVDGPVGLDFGVWQLGGPCGLVGPIGVERLLAFFKLWFLTHNEKSFALWGKFCEKIEQVASPLVGTLAPV